MPVVTRVSHATRAAGSLARIASSTASEIWSAILSGWPSVTDSEVKTWRCAGMGPSLEFQATRAPPRGQLRVGIEQREIDSFRECDAQGVERHLRRARRERGLGGGAGLA